MRWARIGVDGARRSTRRRAAARGRARRSLSAELVHDGERLGRSSAGRASAAARRRPTRSCSTRWRGRRRWRCTTRGWPASSGRSLDEIKAQADELAASRSRIVAAQEAARRQIERDIHDGAQQELVALIARIGLAQNQLGRDSGRLGETLGDLQTEARQALENLRQFASGIHPSVLSDHGLVEAIESRASRLPLGVTIECDPQMRATRFAEAIEGAAYFFVCEGLANALKHAAAERVRVRLVRARGRARGGGLRRRRRLRRRQPSRARGSPGSPIASRRSAARSPSTPPPGRGTTLTARLPIGEPRVVV